MAMGHCAITRNTEYHVVTRQPTDGRAVWDPPGSVYRIWIQVVKCFWCELLRAPGQVANPASSTSTITSSAGPTHGPASATGGGLLSCSKAKSLGTACTLSAMKFWLRMCKRASLRAGDSRCCLIWPQLQLSHLGDEQKKLEVAASPVPSPGPKRGRKWEMVPTASERGTESEVAHKWARWLHNPCRLGDPHRFKAGDKIRSGPQVGKVAT